MHLPARPPARRHRRPGRLRQDRAHPGAVPGAARPLRHRRGHQRHLHRRGRPVPRAQRGARTRAHPRRGDRRLPAHRDPRGRLDQPRGGRPPQRALPRTRHRLRRVGRRQPRRHVLARALGPDDLRDRRLRRRQDPAQGRAGHYPQRPAGDQQDRPRAAGGRLARGHGPRRTQDARRSPLPVLEPEDRTGPA